MNLAFVGIYFKKEFFTEKYVFTNAGRQSKMHSIHDLNLETDFKWDSHLVGCYFIRK